MTSEKIHADMSQEEAARMVDRAGNSYSKRAAVWHRANAVEVPDVPEMIDHPGDTVSCFLAISDGFRIGRARWHYPTKSWCHKGSYDGNILFWSLIPNWDRTSDETKATPPSQPMSTRELLGSARDALRDAGPITRNLVADWIDAEVERLDQSGT